MNKDPSEYWTVSRRYNDKTQRPGYIMNVANRDTAGVRQERWVAVLPHGKFHECANKEEARAYVIWWRVTSGYDERGKPA